MNADEAERITNASKTKQINGYKFEFEKVVDFFDLKIRQAAEEGSFEVVIFPSDISFGFQFGEVLLAAAINHYRKHGFIILAIEGVIDISWGW